MVDKVFIGDYFRGLLGNKRAIQLKLRSILTRLKEFRRQKEITIRAHGIFGSKFVRELHEAAGMKFKSSTVVYNGVEFLHPSDSQPVDRASLLEKGKLKLLFCGRVVEIKGVHTCIEGLPRIRQALPNLEVSLTIVGDSQDAPYIERLKQLAQRYEVMGHINYLQPVSEDNLFLLFQNYDLYLFPSLYEPFSLTLIQALEAGIPTIASDAGGNLEIVKEGKTGLLFPKGDAKRLADAVFALAGNSNLRSTVSAGARVQAANFGLAAMVDRIEATLKSIT